MSKTLRIISIKRPRGVTMEDIKASVILSTLREKRGARAETARALKISLRSLGDWIDRLNTAGVDVPDPPRPPRWYD